jgi:hypothetical protein
MTIHKWASIVALAGFIAGGCAHQAPTIAHVHIGHAMTGWRTTPGKQGFFIVAEKQAQLAYESAQNATKEQNDLKAMKSAIDLVLEATNPEQNTEQQKSKYGVKQAINGAVDHIAFAADSDDASENVKTSTDAFANNAVAVLERCDLITALGEDIRASSSPEEVTVLAEEIMNLAKANVDGEDTDQDGIAGSNPGEYGLAQLRKELDAMIAREDPPYATVDSWYLFNLVRLKTGEWVFRPETSGLGGYDDY